MENSLFKRLGISFAYVSGGIVIVRFGLIVNGADHLANPTWRLVDGLYTFGLKSFFVVLGLSLLIFLILILAQALEISSQNPTPEHEEKPIINTVPIAPQTQSPPIEVPAKEEKKPDPPSPVLSSEELKEKAIKQILRGW